MSHAVRLRQGSCAAPLVGPGGPSPVLLAVSPGVPAAPALSVAGALLPAAALLGAGALLVAGALLPAGALPPGRAWLPAGALPRICGIHNTSAATAGIAHTASAAGAPTRSASGVTVAAASAAMVIVTTLDRLVAPPMLPGTAWRTAAGTSAPAIAIPVPSTTVPAYRPGAPASARPAVPTAISAIPRPSAFSSPYRTANRGARGASSPMHSSGSDVSPPAATLDSPRDSLIRSTNGGSEVSGPRRFAAIASNATMASAPRRIVTAGRCCAPPVPRWLR